MKCITVSVLAASLVLAGCNSHKVKQEERDVTGKYDGEWSFFVSNDRVYQEYGDVYFTCSRVENVLVPVAIEEGRVKANKSPSSHGLISEDGRLYHRGPHGDFQSTDFYNSPAELVFYGELQGNAGTGTFMIASAGENRGCKGTFTAIRKG